METKELLERLEKDLIKIEKEGAELSEKYFLIVDLQENIGVYGRFSMEFLFNAIGQLFETLKKEDKDAGINLLTMLYAQTLPERSQEKE